MGRPAAVTRERENGTAESSGDHSETPAKRRVWRLYEFTQMPSIRRTNKTGSQERFCREDPDPYPVDPDSCGSSRRLNRCCCLLLLILLALLAAIITVLLLVFLLKGNSEDMGSADGPVAGDTVRPNTTTSGSSSSSDSSSDSESGSGSDVPEVLTGGEDGNVVEAAVLSGLGDNKATQKTTPMVLAPEESQETQPTTPVVSAPEDSQETQQTPVSSAPEENQETQETTPAGTAVRKPAEPVTAGSSEAGQVSGGSEPGSGSSGDSPPADTFRSYECVERQYEFCDGRLSYRRTTRTNYLDTSSEEEFSDILPLFEEAARDGCHPRIGTYLCSVLEPECSEEAGGKPLPPCSSFCQDVRVSCMSSVDPRLFSSGVFNCSRYPDSNTTTDCSAPHSDGSSCSDSEFRCKDGRCIPTRQLCDGSPHCTGGEDELNCTSDCAPGQFRCSADGSCIDGFRRCDGTADCSDAEDELSCSASEAGADCDPGSLRCLDGTCVTLEQLCDGVPDCSDGSDELSCTD